MKLFEWIGRENMRLLVERGGLAALNFAVFIYAARTITVEEFGAFTTAMAVWFFAEVVLLSLITEPYLAISGRIRSAWHFLTAWFTVSMAATLLAALVFGLLAYATLGSRNYSATVASDAALFVLTFGFFHAIRRLLIRFGARGSSFIAVATLGLVSFAGMVAIHLGLLPQERSSFSHTLQLAHVAGGGVGLYFSDFVYRFSFRYLRAFLARNWQQRNLIFSSLVFNAPDAGFFGWALGAFAGPLETARFFASRTLMRPVGVLMNAFDDGGRNEAARLNSRNRTQGSHAWFAMRRNNAFFLSVPLLLPLLIFPEFFTKLFFAGKFDDIAALIQLRCMIYLVSAALLTRRILLFNSGGELFLLRTGLWAIAAAIGTAVTGYALVGSINAEVFLVANLALVLFKFLAIEVFLRREKIERPQETSDSYANCEQASGPGVEGKPV